MPISKEQKMDERKVIKPYRLTIPVPKCYICNKEVDYFEIEEDPVKEMVYLHSKCHGREHTLEIPSWAIAQYETDKMFNDARMLTLRGRRVRQGWEK